MNSENIGQFIALLRKERQMTQRDLAQRLNITDKAISKWERGLSCPDISLLTSIAEIFDVSTGELLNGQRNEQSTANADETIKNVLRYADKSVTNRMHFVQKISAAVFTLLLLVGIVTCIICDSAISASLTWSLIPVSSIVFGWLIFFPLIRLGERGVWLSMVTLSVFTIPYLLVLDRLIGSVEMLFPIGIRMSVISIAFLWIIFALFKLLRFRKMLAASISLLLAIPVSLLVNFTLSGIINEPLFDVWDAMTCSILILAAVVLGVFDWITRKEKRKQN